MIIEDAVVSKFPLNSGRRPEVSLCRNPIFSVLSLDVLVIKTALQNGWFLAARRVLEQGRQVFVVRESIHDPLPCGCHLLIREGAKLSERAN